MGFTVTYPGGMKDTDFPTYARLLRQTGKDLGKSPRVSEPGTHRRWLYVWSTQPEAQAFVEELKQCTQDTAWEVVEVNGPASEGPLGPIIIQLLRQMQGLTFGLHVLSRVIIQSAFPQAVGYTRVFIDTQTWYEFRKKRGEQENRIQRVALSLTGLTDEQLNDLGYMLVDAETEKTLSFVPPAKAAQGCGGCFAADELGGTSPACSMTA
jgi:hypothetical protein